MPQDDDYCSMYLDTDLTRTEVISVLCAMCSGTSQLRTIRSPKLEIDIAKNDAFDEEKRHKPDNGFLYYRYHLDITPAPNVQRPTYIEAIGLLLFTLRNNGFLATPVCSFEAHLRTGLDRENGSAS